MGRLKDTTMNLYVVAVSLRNYNDAVLMNVHVRAVDEDQARGRAMNETRREYPNAIIVSMVVSHVTQGLLDWAQGYK
jgi:hypothetical protein